MSIKQSIGIQPICLVIFFKSNVFHTMEYLKTIKLYNKFSVIRIDRLHTEKHLKIIGSSKDYVIVKSRLSI